MREGDFTTKTQFKYYSAIREHIAREGYSPTYAEIAKMVGVSSASVHDIVYRLIEQGYLALVGIGSGAKIRLLPEKNHELNSCHRQHAQIWFAENFCPLCELLMRLRPPPSHQDIVR